MKFIKNSKIFCPPPPTVKAFTLAEVLITLAIIGVVAALTIPSLIINYQKRQYVAQLKKQYSSLTRGFQQAMVADGVTTLSDTNLAKRLKSIYGPGADLRPVKKELLKYFKVKDLYNRWEMSPYKNIVSYKGLTGGGADPGISDRFLIVFQDGSFVLFWTYTSNIPLSISCPKAKICKYFRIFIDINGEKGPNRFGRDMFRFWVLNDGTLIPAYSKVAGESNNDSLWCNPKSNNAYTMGWGCAARIISDCWQMKY